ncbi:ABC transporter substrate-binding protein [Siculibacillus lacustris]|uniref:ABC transporter substrate-binding protein n=1 Tax=Siculibacillus lacustris TaxID=1549641 RepID=A0A4Q9VJK7_9HYPH|nr:ABC transporter substrate-binding protein [Siculibacillus lacustris]TBW35527.1 ABC transporter substrate-binding protein [Siculibacillus lacustris]
MSFRPSRRDALAVAALALIAAPAFAADEVDLGPAQPGRIRAAKVEAAIRLIPADFKFATPGKLTVASVPGRLPFAVLATDNKTPVGSEPDIAQLVADGLGLELVNVPTVWADWPLGLVSGKFDAVIHNVTVTEERKEKFDFSTYRKDLLGFYVALTNKIANISKPEDIAGLKVIVSSGTNQEQILLRWIEANKAKGLAATELQYYDDEAVLDLAIQSGRADAYFGPNATSAFKASRQNNLKQVGTFSGGWPITAEIAVTTRKGSGLADAVTAVLNEQIANGNYAKSLARWSLSAEAIDKSQTNPPGLPKK